MTKVQEIMTSAPMTLGVAATVAEAARAMRSEAIGDILVEDEGTLVGIITDRDVVVRCVARGDDPERTTLGDILSDELVSVGPDDTADDAAKLMRECAIRRLPVVDGGKPVGIVSIGDLAIDLDEHSALADISAAPANT